MKVIWLGTLLLLLFFPSPSTFCFLFIVFFLVWFSFFCLILLQFWTINFSCFVKRNLFCMFFSKPKKLMKIAEKNKQAIVKFSAGIVVAVVDDVMDNNVLLVLYFLFSSSSLLYVFASVYLQEPQFSTWFLFCFILFCFLFCFLLYF